MSGGNLYQDIRGMKKLISVIMLFVIAVALITTLVIASGFTEVGKTESPKKTESREVSKTGKVKAGEVIIWKDEQGNTFMEATYHTTYFQNKCELMGMIANQCDVECGRKSQESGKSESPKRMESNASPKVKKVGQ